MLVRAALAGLALGIFTACSGSTTRPAARTPAAASAPAPPPPPPLPPQEPAPVVAAPEDSPGFAETVAALRPAGTDAALATLAADPAAAAAYAQAALAYAATDAAGMTLLWGMTYQAMGGGPEDAAVARAVSQVLVQRIVASPAENGQDVTLNLRLAPGSMPTRTHADGSVEAPLDHVFEALLGPAVVGFRPPWTVEQFHDAISSWAGLVSAHGTPLDDEVELNGWLVTTAKSGHLEAYCHQLLGPAFPAELRVYKKENAAALKAYQAYLQTAALKPSRAVQPDDLVRVK